MSFQSFRLQPLAPQAGFSPERSSDAESSLSQALGTDQVPSSGGSGSAKKAPYGSGDADDGYTLVFVSMTAFQEWRQREEEEKVIEFVKGDTHTSKAVPPRFKDHTKLVCARHSRSGRKKYVKKYPDRVRKVPSRKLEGIGCPASISYKTYFDTDEVRAMYISEHSHEIGPPNLPFTKRGRRQQAEQARARTRNEDGTDGGASSSSPPTATVSLQPTNTVAGPSSASTPPDHIPPPPPAGPFSHPSFQSAISMPAPMPPGMPPQQHDLEQERWDRMGVLFGSIREQTRTFSYPAASVAALESVLIRLYLEGPVAGMPPPPHDMGPAMEAGMDGMNGMP
ncbi:uncharacterized protein B0H18DRAFT_970107 [Fomitopsis serialis]|uniref:uncharacterized protein n=1 Tax=Fomitopsis serialis TaxID=139415 RepID=UPI0020086EE7|nr:uncharacterized protein B0H18DRAFT_970107 [Neoantrodia serialis]KAH9937333.1 hypothetical protein B0H18DRAFT_970107 [Neoantrodia serialis]